MTITAEKRAWQIEKDLINARVQNSEMIMKLNIGGREKEVSRELLTSVKDTLLAKTFSGAHVLKQTGDNIIFIDRDIKYFDLMLNFLRNDGNF